MAPVNRAESKRRRPAPKPPARRRRAPAPTALVAIDPAEFERRVALYLKASTLKDKDVARSMAETIVLGEVHESHLVEVMRAKGKLTEDQHRVLSATRSNLLRLRKALGVLEQVEDDSSGDLWAKAAPPVSDAPQ